VDRVLLAIFALAVLLPGTFGVSLTDRDEGWYAQVSREMLASGDWLVPTYLGQPWIAKPPLLYWCVAGSYGLLGVHVWAARLVSVLAMVGVVQLLGTLAGELYNRRVALIASVSFLTAGLPVVIGKMLLTDALLLFCCLAAMVALWRIAARGPSFKLAAAFWVLVGSAILAKGPAVFVFVGAFALGLLTRPGARGRLLSARLWLAAPLGVIVAAPWYIYVAQHAGGTLFEQFFWYEVASRIVSTPHGHGGPPGYYLLLSLAGWLPWTALVPGAVVETWRARRGDRASWLLLLWCGLPWLLLELIQSKLPHYILPCYVPLAIMFARMWDTGLDRSPTRGQRLVLGIWATVPILVGLGLIAAAVAWRGAAWTTAGAAAGIALALGFAVAARYVTRGRLWPAWLSAAGATAVFHILVGLWLLPTLEPYRLSRLIAEQANSLSKPGERILVRGYDEPSTFFYLREPGRVVAGDEFATELAAASSSVLIARDDCLRAARISPDSSDPRWRRVEGFNYVKGRNETVWVARLPLVGQSE